MSSTDLQNSTATGSARPEDERVGIGRAILYGAQHILAMYGGVVAVPLVVGSAARLDAAELGMLVAAALFVSGLATLLQSLGLPHLGSQLPLVNGTTIGAASTMLAIIAAHQGDPHQAMRVIFGSVIIAGAVGLVLAGLFARIRRFFPPVVTGTIITAMGVSLLPVAAGWSMGPDPKAPDHGSLTNLGIALFALVVVLICSRIRALSQVAVLVGIVVGTLFAWLLGRADFSQVSKGSVIALPHPFYFGAPVFEIGAILSMTIVMIVTLMEVMADLFAVGDTIGTTIDDKRVADGLRADMLAATVAPVFNSFPPTAFAQNVGLVAVTGIKSRFTVAAGAGLLILLGLFPWLGRLVAAIPSPVLGGVGVVLFGTVAAAGIKILTKADFENPNNLIIVAVALAMVLFPIGAPTIYAQLPSWISMILGSGISSAALAAVVLNLVLNGRKGVAR
ncbi:uracil-xanthine permease family protein [Acidipropionibacterium jensenii]|nr:nucleobase:cation symporter-2 family protein [Acidipropionibacterium jensenii]MDN5977055.1 purine permease [Acidipropionibacterium jensenii]MDN6021211.1 purine permease [Acidipropionibacterium jensenii]MDN6426039.1 purine permease [Acidipropionibacterium jensenii]MDN6441361.1 purine permease [Acidipropionibacterium jensenii]MDN6479343.1 purine permease [Acidipropionibacterium jensenii]